MSLPNAQHQPHRDRTAMKARAVASTLLTRVFSDGHSLSAALPATMADLENARDKGLVQELVYGVLRWYPRLEWLVDQLLDRPLKKRDRDILSLLLVGIYQFLFMRIPPHAVVNETVEAAKELGKPWARHMINAVLRAFQRDRDRLLTALEQNDEAATAHPAWLLARIRKDWPDDWQRIVEANNERPPMTLRVNRRKMEQPVYLQMLAARDMDARAVTGDGIELEKPVDVNELPGFEEGAVSVQDAAAQLVAPLLDAQRGHYVLDACAAPGGKTAHILELQPELKELVAVDIDRIRLRRVTDTLQRLDLHARTICGDAATPEQWWNGELFDRILLDAPCSGSGVIRRHPDIKRLRRAEDIAALAELQRRILNALWPLLKPGGMLLYVTCSIFPVENDEQITGFLDLHQDAVGSKIAASWGHELKAGRQILPGEHNMDGFYFASIYKQ
jgi:16S rRNA (cytosine967-C5)-methyltransferase